VNGEQVEMTPFLQGSCDRAIAILLLTLWNGREAPLSSLRPEMIALVRQRMKLLAERLEEDPGFLAAGADRPDSGLVAGAVCRFYVLSADCASKYWNQQEEQDRLSRAENVSHSILRRQDELVQAISRAWVRIFDESYYEMFLEAVMSRIPNDPEVERWARKNILPASGLKKLGGRLFGGR
jgi:hypothetical protein